MRGTTTQLTRLDSHAVRPGFAGMEPGGQAAWGISFLWPVGAVAAVLYLSVLPFRINFAAITACSSLGLDRLTFPTPTPGDVFTNLAAYLPVGFFLAAYGLGRGRGQARWAVAAFLIAAGLSLTVEVLQTGIAERVPSWWDVICNVAGAAAGVAGAFAWCRRTTTLSSRWHRASLQHKWRTAATLLTVGLFAYHLAPFDFVTTTQALHAAFRHAHLSLSPSHLGALPHELGAAMFFSLLGFVTVQGLTSRGSRSDTALALATLYGITVAGSIEALQLFTASHVFGLASFAFRAVSVMVGVWAGAFIFTDISTLSPRHPSYQRMYRVALLGALIVQVLLLGANLDWSWLTQPGGSAVTVVLPWEALWRAPIHLAVTDMAATLMTYGLLTLTLALFLMTQKIPGALPIACLAVSLGSLLPAQLSSMSSSVSLDITKPLLATVAAFAVVEILRSTQLRAATARR